MTSINKCLTYVKATKPRSAWGKGVRLYAIELLNKAKEWNGGAFDFTMNNYKRILLNGASNWKQYSEGGCSLIYNVDIAKRVCSKSELVKTRYGEKDPNPHEDWLQCQARALYQAESLIADAIMEA